MHARMDDMPDDPLREELCHSVKHRATLYYLFYDVLRDDVGEERAAELMKMAIYRRAVQLGKQYARFAPDDLDGLREAFLGNIPDDGRMFDPEVERADDDGVDIKFQRCPLREAWQEMGLSDAEVARMCEIAAEVDVGLFQGAGFAFSADTWSPTGDGCCRLHIRPAQPTP